jgi:hypothetical protein
LFLPPPFPVAFAVCNGVPIFVVARLAGNLFGFLNGLDPAPIVGRRRAAALSML